MAKRQRGNPVLTLRLDSGTTDALKECAKQHGETVSELLRQLIEEQLRKDGISTSNKPIEGQLTM